MNDARPENAAQSRPALAAGRALIVAHGQPSDPMPAEAALALQAAAVAALLPGWTVGSATLAAPGALEAAVAGLAGGPGEPPLRIYPMFMADGWFTQVNLPRRLREGGVSVRRHRQAAEPGAVAAQAEILAPFGLDRGILPLALASLDAALAEEGVSPSRASLLVAAHGSFKSPAPAAVARRLARAVIAQRGFAELRTGFIDQAPQISQQAQDLPGRAFCLPFFAASGGHVEEDLPAALALAGFEGRVLAPLGLAPGAAALVAAALLRA